MAQYKHTQVGWTLIGMLGSVGVVVALVLALAVPRPTTPVVAVALVSGVVIALFGWLTVTVGDNLLEIRFGVGLIKKRIDLSTVRTFHVVKNRWYYGWGIRFYPGGILYNVSGLGAVELVLRDGKALRVGSDEPEELRGALARALGEPTPLTSAEEHLRSKRAWRWRLLTIGIALIILLGVGGLIYAEMRPPRVVCDATAFHVSSAVYGIDVPLDDIVSVSLESRLPRILMRTNGTGAGRTLRGHFRLEGMGDGQLFLEYGSPPYLLVRTKETFVYVGYDDPARTRRALADLESALRARQR